MDSRRILAVPLTKKFMLKITIIHPADAVILTINAHMPKRRYPIYLEHNVEVLKKKGGYYFIKYKKFEGEIGIIILPEEFTKYDYSYRCEEDALRIVQLYLNQKGK
jgi:hypothetical protein